MSTDSGTSAPPGREIAGSVATLLAGSGSTMTAIQAVERIRAWHETMRALSAVVEAQVMEACWCIRRELVDRNLFDAFVGGHLDGMVEPSRAWLMAETWDVARRSSPLRAFASRQPSEAIEFVRTFVEVGAAEQLKSLDEHDRTLVGLITAPARTRRSRIEALTRQRSLDLEGGAECRERPPQPETAAGLNECIVELRALTHRIDELATVLPDLLAGDASNRARRERIFPLTDLGIGALERIASAAVEASERIAGGG